MMQRTAVGPVVLRRTLASAAQAKPKKKEEGEHRQFISSSGHAEIKASRLPNHLMVTSLDKNGPLSRLAIIFRAGSRYETANNFGITHQLRTAVGMGSRENTAINLSYRTGLAGGNVTAITTRDHFIVQIDVLRDQVPDALLVLGESACQPGFRRWEMECTKELMRLEKAEYKQHPERRLMEMLHRAAYRSQGLANSVFAKSHTMGKHSVEAMKGFLAAHFLSGEAALAGINVAHEHLLKYATELLPVVEGQGRPAPKNQFLGGEVRKEKGGKLAHVVVAGEGPSLKDGKGGAAYAVLASVLGIGPSMQWSGGAGHGMLARAVSKAIGGAAPVPYGVMSVTKSHSDNGIFGVYCVTVAERAGDVVKAAVEPLKEVAAAGVKEADLVKAKAQAKTMILTRAETDEAMFKELVTQSLASDAEFRGPADLARLIDSVTSQDVQQVAKKVANSRPAMAAIGNITGIPYLDEFWHK